MFNLDLPLLVLALAVGALATPIHQSTNNLVARAKATGTNTGTIFQFGSDSAARTTFWISGSCGLSTYFKDKVEPNAHLVAFPDTVMMKYGASQSNKLCGKVATLKSRGKTIKVVVADTNVSPEHSIDMTSDVWKFFGQKDGDGTHDNLNIKWSIDL